MARSRARKRRQAAKKTPPGRQRDLFEHPSSATLAPGRVLPRETQFSFRRQEPRRLIRRRLKLAALPARTPDRSRRAALLNITEVGRYGQNICHKRKQRAAVLHHMGRTGSGTSRRPRIFSRESRLKC